VRLPAALLPLALAGCLSPAVDRADSRLSARIEQVATESRQTAQDAIRQADVATAARVAQVAAEARTARAEALADLDARTAARVADLDARTDVKLARVETLGASILAESAAWRQEAAAWRAEAGSLRAAFTGGPSAVPAPGPAPEPSGEDRALMWAGVAGAAFTLGKTALRLWQSRKATS